MAAPPHDPRYIPADMRIPQEATAREQELKRYLDCAARTVSDAWAALGYRAADIPDYTLAEAIRRAFKERKA
jgi:hypothetical protein